MDEIEQVAKVQDVARSLGADWTMGQVCSVWRILSGAEWVNPLTLTDGQIRAILKGEKVMQ